MLTNADITIYNHIYDKATRLDKWRRTVIHGVHFYVDNKVAVRDSGLNSADVYKIRIPKDAGCDSQYVPEDEYVSTDSTEGIWTLQDGDYVVIGECDLEIERPADLSKAHRQHCKIISWSDNRFGGLPHWRIGGA